MPGIRDIKDARDAKAVIAAEEAQQKFERQAPIRAAQREQDRLLAEIATTERQIVRDTIFKKPSEALKTICTDYPSRDLTREQVHAGYANAAKELMKFLDEQRGIKITSGTDFEKIIRLNSRVWDITSPANLLRAFDYLVQNGVLVEGSDFKVVRTIASLAPAAPEQTLADINAAQESQESLTREGAVASRKLATQGIVLEAQPVFRAFAEHLVKHFDYYITKQEGDQCVEYLRRNNLRLDDKKSWDRCRTKLLNLKTPEEIYNEQMDVDADVLTSREFAVKYKSGFKGY